MNFAELDQKKLYLISSYSEYTKSNFINFFLKINKIIAKLNQKNKKYNLHVATHTGLLAYKDNNWFVYEVDYEGCIYKIFNKKNKIYYITELFSIENDAIKILEKIYTKQNSKIKHKYDRKYNLYAAIFSIHIHPIFNNCVKNCFINILNFFIKFFYFTKYFVYSVFNQSGFKISKNCTARAVATVQEIFWKCKIVKSADLSGINEILQKYEGSYYGIYPQEILNNCCYEILEF
jgi:hypothetical protein